MKKRFRMWTPGSWPGSSVEDRERLIMVIIMGAVGVVVMTSLGVVALMQGNRLLALVDGIASSVVAGMLVLFLRTRKYEPAATIGVAMVAVAFAYFLVSGGDRGTAFVWYFIFPLFSTFLLGAVRGVVLSATLSVFATVYFVLDPEFAGLARYAPPFEVRFSIAYLIVTGFAFVFQRLKELSYATTSLRNRQLERARIAAQQSSNAKGEFLANMSHEFRTPLNHIIGFTELVHDEKVGPVDETQKEYLGDVLKSSRHLLSLINEVLDMSKIGAGRMDLERESLSVREVVDSSLQMLRTEAAEHAIQLRSKVAADIDEIHADRRKLNQILFNLISNAVKYTPDSGVVDVDVRLSEGMVRFSVSDNGIGIAPRDHERIFQPFEQVAKPVHPSQVGTGLGLSLSKSLVELHGGTIWFESEGENSGTTFLFTIPAEYLI